MKPGIYNDISFREYLDIDAVNSSSLKNMFVSPKKYKHMLDFDKKTKSMSIGTAAHSAILEPEKFNENYIEFDGTRRGKQWELFKSENSESEIVTTSEMQSILSIRDSVVAHNKSMELLSGGTPEVTVIFNDATTGILCKARIDYLDRAYRFFTDLKTAREVDHHNFSRQSAQLMYHFQFGFYRMALHTITGVWIPVKCVAAQNALPFDVVAYNISTQALDKGIGMVADCLSTLAQCRESDTWSGISDDEIDLELPAWAADAEEDELIIGTQKVMV